MQYGWTGLIVSAAQGAVTLNTRLEDRKVVEWRAVCVPWYHHGAARWFVCSRTASLMHLHDMRGQHHVFHRAGDPLPKTTLTMGGALGVPLFAQVKTGAGLVESLDGCDMGGGHGEVRMGAHLRLGLYSILQLHHLGDLGLIGRHGHRAPKLGGFENFFSGRAKHVSTETQTTPRASLPPPSYSLTPVWRWWCRLDIATLTRWRCHYHERRASAGAAVPRGAAVAVRLQPAVVSCAAPRPRLRAQSSHPV